MTGSTRVLRLPWMPAGTRIGLGEWLAARLARVGAPRCGGCERRAAKLDAAFTLASTASASAAGVTTSAWGPYTKPAGPTTAANASPCRRYTGRCTGFGRRSCVAAPVALSPDAEVIEQCCGGWFQFPWIEICDGRPPRSGCGFCFW
ncbi:MAG: hypothetical protein O9284_15470 [Steroidobacteraceae bacterium]|nr:hypothetical protein [Steroidobacteraceae bacterium]